MSAYPTDLQREVDRRWLHRFTLMDNSVPVGRPKHSNDIRPLPKPPHNSGALPRKSELVESDHGEQKSSRKEPGKRLMQF